MIKKHVKDDIFKNLNTRSFNPGWVGNEPCWDIELMNGEIHRRVRFSDIKEATNEIFEYPENYMETVRQKNIDAYNYFHSTGLAYMKKKNELTQQINYLQKRFQSNLEKMTELQNDQLAIGGKIQWLIDQIQAETENRDFIFYKNSLGEFSTD